MKAPSAKESTMAQALKGPNTTGLAGLPISGNGKRFQSASDDQANATVISNASSTVIAPYQFPNSKLRTYPKRRGSRSSILVRLNSAGVTDALGQTRRFMSCRRQALRKVGIEIGVEWILWGIPLY